MQKQTISQCSVGYTAMLQHATQGYDTLSRLVAYQMVSREWRPHLSLAERDLVIYLLDNTVSWGKDTYRTTIKQMVHGHKSIPAVGTSESTIYRTLASLKEKGAISTATNGRVSTLMVNLKWNPKTEDAVSILPVPKRVRMAETDDKIVQLDDFRDDPVLSKRQFRTVKMTDGNCQNDSPINSSHPTVSQNDSPHARAREPVAEAIARKKQPRPRSLRSTWSDAWTATFTESGCPPWNRRDTGLMNKLPGKLVEPGIDTFEFVNFAVCRWNHIRVSRFAWMTKPPAPNLPDPFFLWRFLPEFVEAYAEDKMQRKDSTDFSTQAQIDKMVASGKTLDEALDAMAEIRGVANKRRDLAAREKHLNTMIERLDRREPVAAKPNKPVMRTKIVHGDNPFEKDGPVEFETFDGKWDE